MRRGEYKIVKAWAQIKPSTLMGIIIRAFSIHGLSNKISDGKPNRYDPEKSQLVTRLKPIRVAR